MIENKPREQILHDYFASIAEKKQRLTLQNMQMLIDKDLIPEELSSCKRIFLFNKFLKKNKNGIYYNLNDAAITFIDEFFGLNATIDGDKIAQKTWDSMYKKSMEPMRQYLKIHQDEMLDKLNQALYNDVAEKYGDGNISKWEMDSISFYYHQHELVAAAKDYDDFFKLPEEPIVENSFYTKDGKEIKMMKISNIIGTVIDKDKVRNTITLLTPTGVVNVRIYKNQYALYDRQISEVGSDGIKHVKEASWFKRGTLLWIQGFRRGFDFIPRKRKNNPLPIIAKITSVHDDGGLEFQYERTEIN